VNLDFLIPNLQMLRGLYFQLVAVLGKSTDALARAIADYVKLYGQNEPFVSAYLRWAYVKKDGPRMMKQYEAVPVSMRPKSE
jgi:hypothetical protein